MTREELLALLSDLELHIKYYCDTGPHRGKMRIQIDGYVHPDKVAELQKELYDHRNARGRHRE